MQQADDKHGVATGLYWSGMTFQDGESHDYAQARQYFEEALPLWRELGIAVMSHGSLALTLIDLGQCYHFLGEDQRAKVCQDEAIQLSQAVDNKHFLSSAYLYRGYAYLGMHALDLAEADFPQRRRICPRVEGGRCPHGAGGLGRGSPVA